MVLRDELVGFSDQGDGGELFCVDDSCYFVVCAGIGVRV